MASAVGTSGLTDLTGHHVDHPHCCGAGVASGDALLTSHPSADGVISGLSADQVASVMASAAQEATKSMLASAAADIAATDEPKTGYATRSRRKATLSRKAQEAAGLNNGGDVEVAQPKPKRPRQKRAPKKKVEAEVMQVEATSSTAIVSAAPTMAAATDVTAASAAVPDPTSATVPTTKAASKTKAPPTAKLTGKKPKKSIRNEGTSATDRVDDRFKRAMKQKMFLVSRSSRDGLTPNRFGRNDVQDTSLKEEFHVLGSAGNVYKIVIGSKNTCTCMDWQIRGRSMGMNCKHIMFVMVKVLRVSASSFIWSRQYMSQDDLMWIKEHARMDPLAEVVASETVVASWRSSGGGSAQAPHDPAADEAASKLLRLPEEGDTCPICFDDFSASKSKGLVYCIGGCNRPTHVKCQEQWLQNCGFRKTCVYCRGEWDAHKMLEVNERVLAYLDAPKTGKGKKAAPVQEAAPAIPIVPATRKEGYINLAAAAGSAIPAKRDTSTYRRYGKLSRKQQAKELAEAEAAAEEEDDLDTFVE